MLKVVSSGKGFKGVIDLKVSMGLKSGVNSGFEP